MANFVFDIFIFLITTFWNITKDNKRGFTYGVLIFIVLFQLFDISGCIKEKHQRMVANLKYSTYLDDEILNQIAEENKYVVLDHFRIEPTILAAWAFEKKMKTYFTVANSGTYDETYKEAELILDSIKTTGYCGEYIIVTTKRELAAQYNEFENIDVYEKEDIFFIFDNMNKTIKANFNSEK